jgi:mono/diheme cytochrome c family protein
MRSSFKRSAFRALAATVLCGLLTHPARAQDAELARGEHIARFVCAGCHVVARNQEFAPLLSKPAPSFFDIANRPGTTVEGVAQFITHTHWDPDKIEMTMPALMPSPEQSHAVARYLLSLRTR